MGNGNGKELLKKAAPGSGGYDIYVDPDALRSVVGTFLAQKVLLEGRVSAFQTGSDLHGNAFGELPQARGPYHDYQQARSTGIKSLQDVVKLLDMIADALHQSADNYDGADVASTPG